MVCSSLDALKGLSVRGAPSARGVRRQVGREDRRIDRLLSLDRLELAVRSGIELFLPSTELFFIGDGEPLGDFLTYNTKLFSGDSRRMKLASGSGVAFGVSLLASAAF
jgi:hypothetical protein